MTGSSSRKRRLVGGRRVGEPRAQRHAEGPKAVGSSWGALAEAGALPGPHSRPSGVSQMIIRAAFLSSACHAETQMRVRFMSASSFKSHPTSFPERSTQTSNQDSITGYWGFMRQRTVKKLPQVQREI